MAKKGEVVECPCGSLEVLTNDRVPLHKRYGTRYDCRYSGVPAENWPSAIQCPACGGKDTVVNAPPGAKYPLICGACSVTGSVKDFLPAPKPVPSSAPKSRSRYGMR